MADEQQFVDLLERALSSPHGVKVEAANRDSLRQKLYSVRKAARDRGDARFDILTLTTSPVSPDELGILNRKLGTRIKNESSKESDLARRGSAGGAEEVVPQDGVLQGDQGHRRAETSTDSEED
jgi:hypothetical protein